MHLLVASLLPLMLPTSGTAQGARLELRAGTEVPVGRLAESNQLGVSGGAALVFPLSNRLSFAVRGSVSRLEREEQLFFEPPMVFYRDLTTWRYLAELRAQIASGEWWDIGLSLGAGGATLHLSNIDVFVAEGFNAGSSTQTDPAFSGGLNWTVRLNPVLDFFGAGDVYLTVADGAAPLDEDLWSLGFFAGLKIGL